MSERKKVILLGGIGNQLFQYAFCKYLKSKGYDASLDGASRLSTGIANDHLDLICSDVNIIKGERNLNNGIDKSSINKILRIFTRFIMTFKITFEKNFLDLEMNKNQDIFYGYWQNNKYLKEIDLQLNLNPRSITNNSYSPGMESDLAIHIRLGDYLKKKNQKIYTILDKEYYSKAISYVISAQNISRIFLFSNTPRSAQKMIEDILKDLKLKNIELITVDDPEINDFEEMYLMSLAKSIIIANSTFSFWAAYLGNDNKLVVAPANWYVDAQVNDEKASLIAQDNWIYL